MAFQPLAPMSAPATGFDLDSAELIRGLKRNIPVILLLATISLGVAGLVTAFQPYEYTATSTLVVQQQEDNADLKSIASQMSGLVGGLPSSSSVNMLTEIEVIRSRKLMGQVVDREFLTIAVTDKSRERTLGKRAIQIVQVMAGMIPAPKPEDYQILERALTFSEARVPGDVHKQRWSLTRTGETTFALTDLMGSKVPIGEGTLGQPFEARGISFTLIGMSIPVGGRCDLKFRSREAAITDLAKQVDARKLRERADVMAISWSDTSPVQAKYVVNAVTEAYIQQTLEWKSELGGATAELLEGQIQLRELELQSAQQAFNAFKAQSDTVNLSYEAQGLFSELSGLRLNLATQEVDTQQLGYALSRLKKADDREFLVFLEGTSGAVPAQAALVSELSALISERDGMLTSRTSEHPEVARITAQIDSKKRQVLTLVEEAYDTARQRQGLLAGQAGELEVRRQALPATESTYVQLQADVQLATQLLQALKQRKQTNEISQLAAAAPMRVLDVAIAPLRHSAPRWPIQLAMGLLIGLALGLVTAVGRTLLDTTIRQRGQAESLGLPVVALIPAIQEHWRPVKGEAAPRIWLAIRQDPLGPIAESFRILRSAITLANPGQHGRILGITSASVGEGKSLVTLNLASMCAQAGLRTLVIDADLRRPSVARSFGLPTSPGLVEVLENRTSITEALRESGVGNLWLLPAGERTAHPSELLQGEAFPRLLQTLRREGDAVPLGGSKSAPFDVILLDLPPISAVSETLSLGRLTTALYLLIRAGHTPREIAQDALDRLAAAKVAVRGLILNGVHRDDLGRLARYYYHNYSEDQETPDRGLWERLTGQRKRRRPVNTIEP